MATTKQVKPAATVEVSPVSSWKKPPAPMTLPSGNVMKLRRAGFQTFMAAGIIPNSLMSIVESAVSRGQSPDISTMTQTPEQLVQMLEMVDAAVIFCSVEPKVQAMPSDEDEREVELLYVDEVDDEDKMFIFGWSTGGTADVEQFRKESADLLATIQ